METTNTPKKKDESYKAVPTVATQKQVSSIKQEGSIPPKPLTFTATVVDTSIPDPPKPSVAEILFLEIKRALHGESYNGSETDKKNKTKLCNWQLPDNFKKNYCEPINCFLPEKEG